MTERPDRDQQRWTAQNVLARCGVPIGAAFHALYSDQVAALLREAKAMHYRQTKNANGSRARYFHDLMQRRAARES